MALISQNFKNDTVSTTIDVKPLIVLATQDLENDRYNILDVFSTDNVVLKDNYDNNHQAKEILNSITSIKNAVDYNKKKLKINTFRFTLKNYFDPTKTLTSSDKYKAKEGELPDNTFVGSYVILYYKSQSTNTINIDLNPTLSNDDCSIMFTGIINRVDQDDKSIKIQAEDNVQNYISDKNVPFNGYNNLNVSGHTSMEEDDVLPMTYGRVDRVPVRKIGDVNFVDYYQVDSLYASSKQLLNLNNEDSFIFLKGGEDWLIAGSWLNEMPDYEYYMYKFLQLEGYRNADSFTQDNIPLYPDADISLQDIYLNDEIAAQEYLLPMTYFARGAWYGFDGTWEEGHYGQGIFEGSANRIVTSENSLFFNKGWEFKWYRHDDIQYQTHNYLAYNVDTSNVDDGEVYYPQGHSGINYHRAGRWSILSFPKKIGFSQLIANINLNTPSQSQNTVGTEFWIKPIIHGQYKELQASLWDSTQNADYTLEDIIYDRRNDNLDDLWSPNGWEEVGAVCVHRSSTGEIISLSNINTEIEVDSFLMFEYFNDGTENSFYLNDSGQNPVEVNVNQSSGVFKSFGYKLGPTYMLGNHTVDKNDEKFASVQGRRSYSSTEDLSFMLDEYNWLETLGINEDTITLQQIINGVDLQAPSDFSGYTELVEQNVTQVDNIPQGLGGFNELYLINPLEFMSFYNFQCSVQFEQGETFDYLIEENNLFKFDDNKILRLERLYSKVLNPILERICGNAMEFIAREWLASSIAQGKTIYMRTNSNISENLLIYTQEWEQIFSEDYLGYNEYKTMLMEMSANVVASNQENYWLHGLIDESPSVFQDTWFNEYADVRKCVVRRLLKLIYQSDLNYDPVDDMFNFEVDWNISSQYPDFNIDSTDSINYFIDYLNFYINDILSTVNKSIFDHLSGEGEERWYYYNYNNLTLTEEELRQYGAYYDYQYQTDGIINKPVDIIIDILRREMSYGVNEGNLLDNRFYDEGSIYKSRDVYADWKMGFCIDKSTDGKKLIEDILSETMSYFTFTPQGKFSLVTLKEKYTIEDIDHFIKEDDILKYKFSKTKKEDLVLHSKFFYRYDNGINNYPFSTETLKIENLLPDYDGYNYYNLDEKNLYKEKKLRYHSETDTVNLYHKHYLLNNCNQHLLVKLELPLNYADVKIADIINLPLINNDVVFGLDYSKVQMLNGQPIYPAFIVTSVDIKLDKVLLEAYQLHYLGTDGLHGFGYENEQLFAIANLNEYNSKYPEIHNWNYIKEEDRDPNYTYIQGAEIPYGDLSSNGDIDVVDLVNIVNHIIGTETLNEGDATKVANYNFNTKTINPIPDNIDVVKVVQLMDIIFE